MNKALESFLNWSGLNKKEEPIVDSSITLYGKQSDLTRDQNGKFKHPFLN